MASMIPVIDIFAGPGGLGEGFDSFPYLQTRHRERGRFDVVLSIEKEPAAHQTLQLRSFFRQFPGDNVPEEYYGHLRGELDLQDLYKEFPEAATTAARRSWLAELGKEPPEIVRTNIRNALKCRKDWVLVGGPPCQAYSNIGRVRNRGIASYRPELDERHFLYEEYLRIIADHWPAVFVMENVKGLLSAKLKGQAIFDQILRDLRDPVKALEPKGYQLTGRAHGYRLFSLKVKEELFPELDPRAFLLHCENYGVPQRRHRLIIVGVRDDIRVDPQCLVSQEDEVPVHRVLDTLPRLRSGLSPVDSADAWLDVLLELDETAWFIQLNGVNKVVKEKMQRSLDLLTLPKADLGQEFRKCRINPHKLYLADWYVDQRLGGICNHTARTHMESDLHRYLFCAAYGKAFNRSPKLRHFPEELLPNHKSAAKKRDFADRFRVQVANQPATTVVSHIANDGHYFIHYDPTQCRSLTVREAARIQTFPDNYFFCGSRTAQYRQVGNAVPPWLAHQIAGVVADLFDRSKLNSG